MVGATLVVALAGKMPADHNARWKPGWKPALQLGHPRAKFGLWFNKIMGDLELLRKELVSVSHWFYQRGWSLATSSNFSARVDANRILITASGKDKGALCEEDVILVDRKGRVLDPQNGKASAETLLHCRLYAFDPEIGSVLHTHSVHSTILSIGQSQVTLTGYEMLKAFGSVDTHHHAEVIPVVPNSQDMEEVWRSLPRSLASTRAFLIAGHGLYTWGRDIAEAKRHVETFEFLFECEYRKRALPDA